MLTSKEEQFFKSLESPLDEGSTVLIKEQISSGLPVT